MSYTLLSISWTYFQKPFLSLYLQKTLFASPKRTCIQWCVQALLPNFLECKTISSKNVPTVWEQFNLHTKAEQPFF